MLDDQFISSPSWLPSARFKLRTLAGYTLYKPVMIDVLFPEWRKSGNVIISSKLMETRQSKMFGNKIKLTL